MLMPFSLTFRIGLIALFVWVATTNKPTHGGVLLAFLAGLSVLSLFSDDKLRKWFVMPEQPNSVKVPNHDGTAVNMKCHIGFEDQYREHFADILDDESILMAAIRHTGTGQIWAVERPGRHPHITWAMDALYVPEFHRTEEGFLTSYGRYVERNEAALIAAAAGQLLNKQSTPAILFSEDVWETPPWKGLDQQEGVAA
jgi:hypothetical protein